MRLTRDGSGADPSSPVRKLMKALAHDGLSGWQLPDAWIRHV